MDKEYNLCLIKPNRDSFSETFIQEHIDKLAGNKKVLYGGSFPVYDEQGKTLIKSKLGLLSYLFQKRVLKRTNIAVRTRALVNYLLTEKIDVVFAEYGTVGASVTEACKLAGIPLVIHFHGFDVYHHETIKSYKALYNKAFQYACALIAVSDDMAETLKQMGAPAGKVYVASCGVDTRVFALIDIANSDKNFLSVGRFVEKKSPLSVVKAFKIVVEKYPDAKLWMVGNGPLFNETKNAIDQLGLQQNIILTGVQKPAEIRNLMGKMRGFVQHSVTAANGDREGTPVSVLEASSSGLPVVSTRHSGIKQAIIDGKTGFLTDEYDIKETADKIIELAGSAEMAVRMGKAGREHMITNYEINSRIAMLNNIVQECIASNSDK